MGQSKKEVSRTLYFHPERFDELDQVMLDLKVSTFKDFSNIAFSLITWYRDQVKDGRRMFSVKNYDPKTVQEFAMNGLPYVSDESENNWDAFEEEESEVDDKAKVKAE